MKLQIAGVVFAFVVVGLSACQKNVPQGTSGQAKVAFAKVSGQSIDDEFTTENDLARKQVSVSSTTCPNGNTCVDVSKISKFEIKLLNVGISTEADTTKGYSSAIYLHPDCPQNKLSTEIDGKYYDYIGFDDCGDDRLTTYLDLRKSAAEVHSDLNSQLLPIAPGSYKYGFLSFCIGGAKTKNYKVTMSNDAGLPDGIRGQTFEVSLGTCGTTTPEFSPAMTVAEGQSVTVTLEYDLANTVYYRALSGGETVSSLCAAATDGGTTYQVCVQAPTISAGFSTN